jgi:phospholipase/lecithinase/hemolysin
MRSCRVRVSRALGGRLACALALLLLAGGAGRAEPITGIVAFGDSLSDIGNVYAATHGAFPPASSYGGGRFSNGSIWVEWLAVRLGVSFPGPLPSTLGGTDYAYGFAQTGIGTTQTPVPGLSVPNLWTQMSTYLSSHTPSAGQLYTVWAGANDLFTGHTGPVIAATNVAAVVDTLARAGASNILVANLPALGDTPFGRTLPSAQRQGLNAEAASFNNALAAELSVIPADHPGVSIHLLDAAGVLQRAEADPAAYGFSNVTDPAQLVNGGHVNGYLFWDGVHPTFEGHALIADAAVQALGEVSAQALPEPSTLALMAIGLAGAAAGKRLRTRSRAA